jgi:peptidoglycan/xylan/chitin deacetylase (PgdA/CDA1 family)
MFGALVAGCAGARPAAGPPPSTTSTPVGPERVVHGGPPYRFGDVQEKAPPTVDGKAPVIRRIPTDKRYVFITIDDGDIKDPDAVALILRSGFRPTLFLAQKYVTGSAAYFADIRDKTGADIEDHTINHPSLRGRPYEFQRKEICDNADAETAEFGRRPVLIRPPYGNWDVNTQKAAATCGMRAIVLWTAAVNDGVVQFQTGDHLNPGDIVLMHFRHTFVADYTAFVERARRDGLTAVPLPDFLG